MTGDEIKEFRLSKGLTQTELADILGVKNKASIAQWEKGKSLPNSATRLQLEKLMSGEWAIIPLTAQEEQLLDEGVERGGYTDREEYLFAAITHLLRNKRFDEPRKTNLRAAEDEGQYGNGKAAG